uniref:Ribosomal protein L19 n=1 Tax=Hildenbrandia rivularis TaxID=135206 RepID=A0A1C9CFK7_9FLOR|nr:ribosomal protein L19 [Hildenbrandia rivularis]AOM67180.1 ribosomal protein L19 [Hildenbrandia rivularis]
MNFKNSYELIQQLESKYLKQDIPKFSIGDVIQIGLLIQEADKERVQLLQGIIISIKNAGLNTTITTRKILQRIGVERIYLVHSPKIVSFKIVKQSQVKKAKLFYLRSKYGKAARLRQKFR